jgi:hypothetical protein
MTDFGGGPLKRFLGVEIEQDTSDNSIRLHQGPYLDELFTRLNITGSATSPEEHGDHHRLKPAPQPLNQIDKDLLAAHDYKGAVAALFYIARATRPDIVHAVGQVARFMDRPGPLHLQAVIRIYNYLRRTRHNALRMATSDMNLSVHDCEAFADADWKGCTETRKSTSGYIIRVGGSTVGWHSKRQGSIATSPCEASYVSAAAAANEIVWWRRLLADFGSATPKPTRIHCSSENAIAMASTSTPFTASKHIGLRLHVLRRYQALGVIDISWLASPSMLADVMTTNLHPKPFRRLASTIRGEEI